MLNLIDLIIIGVAVHFCVCALFLIRFIYEEEELDGQMPLKFVKRWVGWLRGGWRV